MKPTRGAFARTAGFVFFLLTFSSFAFQINEQSGDVSATETTCKTGADGRVQLDLGNGAILRLGANSALQLNGKDAPGLKCGTALFDFGKTKQQLALRHAGRNVTVKGGTGFARHAEGEAGQGSLILVGSLAGRVSVTMAGKTHRMQPGQWLAIDTDGKVAANDFNLARLAESSSLLKDFTTELPGQKSIQRELKQYASLQKRGFIRTTDSERTRQLLAAEDVNLFTLASSSVSSLALLSSGPSGISSPTAMTVGDSTITLIGEALMSDFTIFQPFTPPTPGNGGGSGGIGIEIGFGLIEVGRQRGTPVRDVALPPLPPTELSSPIVIPTLPSVPVIGGVGQNISSGITIGGSVSTSVEWTAVVAPQLPPTTITSGGAILSR